MENSDKKVVIDIKDLKKSFGDQVVLDGINLQLHENENLVILGNQELENQF